MSQSPTKKFVSKPVIIVVSVIVALGLLALGTKVVPQADLAAVVGGDKDPATFVETNYATVIVPGITERALDVVEVADALSTDKAQAEADLAQGTGPTATYSVSFTGTAGEVNPKTGYLPVAVEGLPEGVEVQIQTGPALLGTALRDATGKAGFAQFTNQLDYQKVGDLMNQQMKADLLDGLDIAGLNGQTVSVVGAFQSVNPQLLLIMPVSIEVAP